MPERQQTAAAGEAAEAAAAWTWPPQSELISSTMQRDIAMPRLKGLLVDAAGTLLYPVEPVVDVSAGVGGAAAFMRAATTECSRWLCLSPQLDSTR